MQEREYMMRTHHEELGRLQDQLHSQAQQILDLHKQIAKVRTWPRHAQRQPRSVGVNGCWILLSPETSGLLSNCCGSGGKDPEGGGSSEGGGDRAGHPPLLHHRQAESGQHAAGEAEDLPGSSGQEPRAADLTVTVTPSPSIPRGRLGEGTQIRRVLGASQAGGGARCPGEHCRGQV